MASRLTRVTTSCKLNILTPILFSTTYRSNYSRKITMSRAASAASTAVTTELNLTKENLDKTIVDSSRVLGGSSKLLHVDLHPNFRSPQMDGGLFLEVDTTAGTITLSLKTHGEIGKHGQESHGSYHGPANTNAYGMRSLSDSELGMVSHVAGSIAGYGGWTNDQIGIFRLLKDITAALKADQLYYYANQDLTLSELPKPRA